AAKYFEVFTYGQIGVERNFLRCETDVAKSCAASLTAHIQTAGSGFDPTAYGADQCGLASSVCSQQTEDIAFLELDVDAGKHLSLAIAHAQMLNIERTGSIVH